MADVATIYRLAAENDPTWVLRLDGNLEGEAVEELRSEWRRLRNADRPIPVLIELENAEFVDDGGNALLAEMRQAGTAVVVSCDVFEARRRISSAFAGGRRS